MTWRQYRELAARPDSLLDDLHVDPARRVYARDRTRDREGLDVGRVGELLRASSAPARRSAG